MADNMPLAKKNMAGLTSLDMASTDFDDRREQMLLMNHCDDSEEHNQQRGKGQGLLKRMPNVMLVGDAIEGRQQHNHQQANQAHRSEVKCAKRKYQNQQALQAPVSCSFALDLSGC